jgi:type IV pilus assembly protein PilV
VLVTILILAIGLLGLAGLQITTLNNQFEAYQRAQAVLLIEDMAGRIRVNSQRARVGDYALGSQYGTLTGSAYTDCSTQTTTALRDLCDWNSALSGVGVALAGANIGGVVGARGCIESIANSADDERIIRVTVAWQGLYATALPGVSGVPASTCGQGAFGIDDNFRRFVWVDVVLADLAI